MAKKDSGDSKSPPPSGADGIILSTAAKTVIRSKDFRKQGFICLGVGMLLFFFVNSVLYLRHAADQNARSHTRGARYNSPRSYTVTNWVAGEVYFVPLTDEWGPDILAPYRVMDDVRWEALGAQVDYTWISETSSGTGTQLPVGMIGHKKLVFGATSLKLRISKNQPPGLKVENPRIKIIPFKMVISNRAEDET